MRSPSARTMAMPDIVILIAGAVLGVPIGMLIFIWALRGVGPKF